MKILFISNYSELYGANRSLLTLLNHFNQKEQYEIRLFIPSKGGIVQELEKCNIKYDIIPYISQLWYYKLQIKYLVQPLLILFTLLMLPYLVIRAKKYHPDIIYSNTSAENVGIIIAKTLGVKHISHIREFMDLDHSAKFVGGNDWKKKYIDLSDGIIYVSKSVAEWVNQSPHLSSNQTVVYNGVNMPCMNPHKCHWEQFHFGIVGILDEEKGQHIAIQYFHRMLSEMPSAKLHIYGDKEGEYKKLLHRLVDDLNMWENVVFHGFVKDAATIYNEMDVLLMCSRMEGFGRVTVEAMQHGIPVIGYNAGGTSEIVINNKNGFLFEDEEQFVNSVHELFSSPSRYEEISAAAYQDSHYRFSIERYCESVEQFVESIYNS
ncbi:MAG: glycosyltransferase [Prevotellaceae bacterium]|nr:glycosyltransferase [Prevotellaceae bacterium]